MSFQAMCLEKDREKLFVFAVTMMKLIQSYKGGGIFIQTQG